ncbi:glycosyltransferase family 1 protein [Corynebacterium aquatimens]|uniref:glycosyltransferase family 1 protein n=1 Tax=Corynebacterium TaxID=1716 RepID=UPI001F32DE8B|nr:MULTISPECIES: glycosyltransferase family 1 protein [Corynebacterium]QYH19338.1 glycosyltransferase family 1 protein [Corynebacterium aquatimens]UIZ91763.1 glycosyltransferase family 1 protein [Corynebacterium sp. CNCTC7651]
MIHLIVGPAGHGVTAYALQLADALGAGDDAVVREETFTDAPLPDAPIHVAFTDHLFGTGPDASVEKLLARVGARPLSVSFHDVPQPEEGEARYARRSGAYRRLAAAADVVGVNSQHEARFFEGFDPAVIRLPIPVIQSRFAPEPGTVGVLGFLYPGKGHEDLIAALDGSGRRLRFLGSVSKGHEAWAEELSRHAEITGWLTDAQMAEEMGRIEVPVCAHRHFSASGSLMTWLGAGRTVLAKDSDYTREIDAWLPGRITLVSGDWRSAVEAFEPEVLAPPSYGWADVASEWEDAWHSAGLM